MDGILYLLDHLGREVAELTAERDRLLEERDEMRRRLAAPPDAEPAV